ncbi:MAG TPA: hypothetical protein VM243_14375 [Phycisphaerae bacterium]|nr:hypothetical protein [Phycisphaerae bacterium]
MERRRPKTYEADSRGKRVRVTVPQRHETVTYGGDAKDVLRDVLRDNLSPQAVAVIVAHIESIRTNNHAVSVQVRWFADTLIELVGGPDQLNRLYDELGI